MMAKKMPKKSTPKSRTAEADAPPRPVEAGLSAPALLLDAPDSGGRTTASLLASLIARVTALHFVTGATSLGWSLSGLVVLGRQVSQTAAGARLRKALAMGKAAKNLTRLWTELHLGEWASLSRPAPVLDQMRNDVALLLSDDLEEAIARMPMPSHPEADGDDAKDDQANPADQALDFVVGLWSYCRETVEGIEAVALKEPKAATPRVTTAAPSTPPPVGRILR